MNTPEPPAATPRPVLVARCENYREDLDTPCTGRIHFRWGQSQAACDTCGAHCGIAVAAWERVELAGAVPDTGQARDDVRGWLHEQIEAGGDPMLARVLDALNEPSGDTAQAPDVAALLPVVRAAIAYHESTGPSRGDDAEDELLDRVAELPADIRALLGTDTTPDRLAWISEAGETAAVERQARYQETACARRPAATSGDPAQPDLAYARSEVDKWLADNDPYCILPTRTEHIPALLARLDELEGTR